MARLYWSHDWLSVAKQFRGGINRGDGAQRNRLTLRGIGQTVDQAEVGDLDVVGDQEQVGRLDVQVLQSVPQVHVVEHVGRLAQVAEQFVTVNTARSRMVKSLL